MIGSLRGRIAFKQAPLLMLLRGMPCSSTIGVVREGASLSTDWLVKDSSRGCVQTSHRRYRNPSGRPCLPCSADAALYAVVRGAPLRSEE